MTDTQTAEQPKYPPIPGWEVDEAGRLNPAKSMELLLLFAASAGEARKNAGEILASFHLSLRGARLSCWNLSYADLSDADLSGANLAYADLRCAELSDANLSGANLTCAYLGRYTQAELEARGAVFEASAR